MCNHGDDKRHTYIPILDPAGEIYMCECGAMVNLMDQRNLKGDLDTLHVMNADDLTSAVSLTAVEAIQHTSNSVSLSIASIRDDWKRKGKR